MFVCVNLCVCMCVWKHVYIILGIESSCTDTPVSFSQAGKTETATRTTTRWTYRSARNHRKVSRGLFVFMPSHRLAHTRTCTNTHTRTHTEENICNNTYNYEIQLNDNNSRISDPVRHTPRHTHHNMCAN